MSKKHFSVFILIRRWFYELTDKVILWFTARLFGLGLAIFLCFPYRYRMSHNNGVAALGKIKVVDHPEFPEHYFFAAGKEYPARIRHASATFLDDAMNCIRSISVKFSHHHFKSPFDIEMNTGATSLFWSAVSFLKFGKMRKEKWGVEYVEYNRKYPDGLKAAELAVRRHASSFHNLHYYCKTPFLFIGTDGLLRYAKYRILPFEKQEETGKDTDPSATDTSNQRILPHETRSRNYLKDEYIWRVKTLGAKYMMQIQTRMASDDDDEEIFNNMILWDDKIHPWHDLLVIDIDTPLDWKESTLTSFSVNSMPKTLGIIPAKSIYDYNSLNYLRSKSEIARKARLFSYRIFGMVPPIPDDDDRNTGKWSEPQF